MTDTSVPDDPNEVSLENASVTAVRSNEHVLTSCVEVWETYEQAFDADRCAFVLGPSTTEDHYDPFTEYTCSCGESFTDQDEAHQHLLDVAE